MRNAAANAIRVDLRLGDHAFEFSGMTHMQAVSNLTLVLDKAARRSSKPASFAICREHLKEAARLADFLGERIFRDILVATYRRYSSAETISLSEFQNACEHLSSMWRNDVLRDNPTVYKTRE